MSRAPFALTAPCAQCPFRTDIHAYLTKRRVVVLERDLVTHTFSCHKTVNYGRRKASSTDQEAHCAGALILLEKLARPSQPMRIAGRLRLYDPEKLDMAAPVFASFDAMRKAQPR